MLSIPNELHGRAFTRSQALAAGLTPGQLRGPAVVRLTRGVYRTAQTPETIDLIASAGLAELPKDAAVSHLSNLRLRGLDLGPLRPVHFVTANKCQRIRDGFVIHRFAVPPGTEIVRGIRAVEPYRTFVDCATVLRRRALLVIGDWMVAQQLIRPDRLVEFVNAVHFDGVRRARRVAPLVRIGAESPKESELRWELVVIGGLPEPELNVNIFDDWGEWLARGDLVYRHWKVLVEYDGWYHERSAAQRQRDLQRRERLEAAGWIVIVVTSEDMKRPAQVVARVASALRARGWSL